MASSSSSTHDSKHGGTTERTATPASSGPSLDAQAALSGSGHTHWGGWSGCRSPVESDDDAPVSAALDEPVESDAASAAVVVPRVDVATLVLPPLPSAALPSSSPHPNADNTPTSTQDRPIAPPISGFATAT